MKSHPILFSAPMVLALLAYRKTVTRRMSERWDRVNPGDRLWVRETWGYRGTCWESKTPTIHEHRIDYRADGEKRWFTKPADDREGLPKQRKQRDGESREAIDDYMRRYWAMWRPSIFMPRWASRITLEVVSVRAEPLQAITNADVMAEGVIAYTGAGTWSPSLGYAKLWDALNPKHPWSSNPVVRRVEFRRIEVQ